MSQDIVGRYIPKFKGDRLFELREMAQARGGASYNPDGMRVRALTENERENADRPVFDPDEKRETVRIPHCKSEGCDNLLTIGDRWGICEECRRKGF